jgi:hypothetical protein
MPMKIGQRRDLGGAYSSGVASGRFWGDPVGRLRLAALILVGVLGCSRGKAPVPVATAAAGQRPVPVQSPAPAVEHRFELLSFAGAEPPSAGRGGLERCLYGRHPAGVQVLLLSDEDSSTCPVKTGRVGVHYIHGDACTVLVGAERCEVETQSYTVGVIGSRGAYQHAERQVVHERAALDSASQVILDSKAVETASSRWKDTLDRERKNGRAPAFTSVVSDAVSWPGVAGAPTLVRTVIDGSDGRGPWVAISGGKVVALMGPFSMEEPPRGFVLDGKPYVRMDVAGCTLCGFVGTEIYALENGKARRVLESYANAN